MGNKGTLLAVLILLCIATLSGCGSVKVYEAATGLPVKNYEITMKTPGEFEPVIAQFHIVRMVYEGKYQYRPEYYDIFKNVELNRSEAEKTMSLRMVIRIINPTGLKIALMYRKQSLTDGREKTKALEEEEEEEAAKAPFAGNEVPSEVKEKKVSSEETVAAGEEKQEAGQAGAVGGKQSTGTREAGAAVWEETKEAEGHAETKILVVSEERKSAEEVSSQLETKEPAEGAAAKEQDKPIVAESEKKSEEPVQKKKKGIWESLFPVRTKPQLETKVQAETTEQVETKQAVETVEPLKSEEMAVPMEAKPTAAETEAPAEVEATIKTEEELKPLATEETREPAETKQAVESVEPLKAKEPVVPVEIKQPVETAAPVETKEPLTPVEMKPITPIEAKMSGEAAEPLEARERIKTDEPAKPLEAGETKGEEVKAEVRQSVEAVETREPLKIKIPKEDKPGWISKDEVVYTGNDRDVLRFIDCPMTKGKHKVGLWVYRDNFLLFEFANFEYIVK